MTQHRISFKRSLGLGMVELMVGVAVGSILMLGITQVFISNKATHEITDDLARMQENARFAIETLTRDIRMAGYFGCMDDVDEVFNHVNGASAGDLLDTSNPIEGFEQGDTEWLPASSPASTARIAEMVPNTDAISLRFLDGTGVEVTTPYMPTTAAAIKTDPSDLEIGEIVAITDCQSTDIFQITNTNSDSSNHVHNTGTGSPGNATQDLSKTYADGSSVARLIARRYYIGTGTNGPALFRESMSVGSTAAATGEEFVEGIENLQLTYGEDTDGDRIPDAYVDADDVDSWDNVVSVRVGLLARTVDEYGTKSDAQTYAVNGYTPAAASDRRSRRVYTSTVLMRNL